MSQTQIKRIGRLMAVFWPLLIIIANTQWLMTFLLPPMSELTYENSYRRDWFIPVAAKGSLSFVLDKVENSISLRPTQNGKGSILSVKAEIKKGKYNYALGIA